MLLPLAVLHVGGQGGEDGVAVVARSETDGQFPGRRTQEQCGFGAEEPTQLAGLDTCVCRVEAQLLRIGAQNAEFDRRSRADHERGGDGLAGFVGGATSDGHSLGTRAHAQGARRLAEQRWV